MEIIVGLTIISAALLWGGHLRPNDGRLIRNERLTSAAVYVIATFTATYGSIALAGLLGIFVLIAGKAFHSASAITFFDVALDRPYFPLQSVAALTLGLSLALRLRRGKPLLVCVWPVIQVVVGIARHGTPLFGSFTTTVWRDFFNWGCGCSITLFQWNVMAPLYPSVAFTLGVLIRYSVTDRVAQYHVLRSHSANCR